MLLYGASPAVSTLGTSRRFPLGIPASGEFAGLLLAQRKPEHSWKAEGLYAIALYYKREDGTPAWKRGAKRGKKPEQSARDTGEPSLPLHLPC